MSKFDAEVTRLYDELRRLARRHLNRERTGHTLDSVALVAEAFERLRAAEVAWETDPKLFALFGQTIRRVLVDHARAKSAEKRGGDLARVTLSTASGMQEASPEHFLDFNAAIDQLGRANPEALAMVEARLFIGLTTEEAAKALGLTVATARRRWQYAKVLLRRWLESPDE